MVLAESSDTSTRILRAAFRRLLEEGYANLSTRAIAADAGVNHALIHYYFGTKDKLVVAALDDVNDRLLARQVEMYAAPMSFAEKWSRAVEFYREDLASGFVRVQMELLAASLSNPALRQEVLPRVVAWRRIVESGVREALKQYGLDFSYSADAIACWIVDFWWGMEFETVLGLPPELTHHTEALDAMQRLLEHLDAGTLPRSTGAINTHPAGKGGTDERDGEHAADD